MLGNFFIVAFRNIRRNKIFSLITITGLAIGLTAALIIYMIVSYQFSFDAFEKDNGRIYRVVSDMHFPDQVFKLPGVPAPMPAAVKKEIPGIEVAAPLYQYGGATVKVAGTGRTGNPVVFKKEQDNVFCDDGFFALVRHQWLAGNPVSLQEPFRVVLTESTARKYFPGIDPTAMVGRTLTYNDSINVSVAGVVEDIREVTEFRFKAFISISTISSTGLAKKFYWDSWSSISSASQFLVKLNKGVSPVWMATQIQALRAKYLKKANLETIQKLQPLRDIHFNAEYGNFDSYLASKSTMYALLLVAGFLLLLGSINFINLMTAQASQRAKEVGIRKTLGSRKGQLMAKFLSETFLLTSLATILSIAVAPVIFKAFTGYIPPGVSFSGVSKPEVWIFAIILTATVSLLSGFYPALVLTRFKPAVVLKSQVTGSLPAGRSFLRKSLTVIQFAIAQFFLVATIVVVKQIHYSQNKDLGFRKNAIIHLELPYEDKDISKRVVLMNKLRMVPEINKVALGGAPPASDGMSISSMTVDNGRKKIETTVELMNADPSYFGIYQMRLLAGRLMHPSDTATEYLINNTYAKFLGFQHPADAIGHFMEHGQSRLPIVGVLADFHSKSLHQEIKPLAYCCDKESYYTMHIGLPPHQMNGDNWKTAIARISKAWKEVYPDQEMEYVFFDESIAKFYKTEEDTSVLLTWASGLTIFISCLGLFGLAIYTTNRRTKEIGVRKVLGASVAQIVLLLSRNFILLIAVAFVVATPAAWWAMHHWLDDFAYRTTLDWWIFMATGVLMMGLALFVLTLKTARAASVNPVKSLRTE
jgi:ABC-type antimicrobial peptide transport system permease subunit